MKKKRAIIPAWALVAIMALSLTFAPTGIVFAGEAGAATTSAQAPVAAGIAAADSPDAPALTAAAADPAGSLDVTGFKITRRNGTSYSNYTGRITKGNTLTVKVDVLDSRVTAGAPVPLAALNAVSFSIPKQANITYTTPSVSADGCTYTITFKDLKYRGVGNSLDFDVSYSGLAPPIPMQPVSLTLNQCVEYVPPEPVDPTPAPTPAPEPMPEPQPEPGPPDVTVKGTGFILKDASYGGGEPIYAGQVFTLHAVLLATNGTYAVENVSASFSPPEELTFADGSSVVYIGTMSPGASVPVSATLLPSANIQEGSYTIGIEVSGVNQQTGDPVSATMTVSMPILQPERFEIFNTMLPTDLMAGMDSGMGYGSVTLVNQGKGAVANVSFEITGDGLYLEDGRMYIGNVGGGEQRSADFNLLGDTTGMIDALVLITYENVRGEIKTLEHPFTVNVMDGGGGSMDPGFEDPGFMDPGLIEGGQRGGPPNWVWIIIIIAAAAVAAALLARRHRKKKKAAEAALDDIPDDDD